MGDERQSSTQPAASSGNLRKDRKAVPSPLIFDPRQWDKPKQPQPKRRNSLSSAAGYPSGLFFEPIKYFKPEKDVTLSPPDSVSLKKTNSDGE